MQHASIRERKVRQTTFGTGTNFNRKDLWQELIEKDEYDALRKR